MNILPNVLDRQYKKYRAEYIKKAKHILDSGWYILGNEVKEFEKEFAKYIGAKYCIGLANGLDALWITFKLLGIQAGDEVIIQGNAYVACVMGITMNGATPVFIEPDEYHNINSEKIEEKITDKTKAVLVVHLYGQASNMQDIKTISDKYNLYLVEDCAQSHGARHCEQITGTFGHVGCFSFYPSKNLGAFGDGGAIVTDDEVLMQKFKTYRNYGSQKKYENMVVGTNSRLDSLQAGLLRVKLTHLNELNNDRASLCNRYLREIKSPLISLPKIRKDCTTVWHQFVITTDYRDELVVYLNENNIFTSIHYPIPPYLQEAYKYLEIDAGDYPISSELAKKVLSLPLYNGMTKKEQRYVINKLNKFKIQEDY